tara:strand:+ start:343 stop:1170 length:828 start_codon:yes stop_codon:yes gene_type:complete
MTQDNSGTAGFNTTPPPEASVNGTGQLAPQPEAATGLAPVSPEGTVEQQPSIETMQARIAELEANATKRENDYRSLQGRIKSQQGDDSRFDELSENVMTLNDTVAAFIRHQGTNDEEMFREDLQKIDSEAQTRKQTSTFQRTSQLMIDEISQTVKDAGLDLQSAAELAEFRELWGPAYDGKDIAGLYQAQAAFNRAMRVLEVRRREEAELAHKEAMQKTLEEHGVNTLDLDSSSSAPASMSSNNLLSRLGNSEMAVSRDEITQAAEQLRQQGIRF